MVISVRTFFKGSILAVALMSNSVCNANVLKADEYFKSQAYTQALTEYLAAAKVGNPHAYYRLGMIYHKGLGVKSDKLNALIYFDLAAEYDYHNAKQLISQIFNRLSPETQTTVRNILDQHKQTNGKNSIQKALLPELITENLDKKITFEGQPALEHKIYSDDLFYEESDESMSFTSDEDDDSTGGTYNIMSTPKEPYLIVDNDVATDGSIRNITEVQAIGSVKSTLDSYKLFPTLKPTFEDKPVEFVNRVTLGAANYDKFTLIDQRKALYSSIYRKYKELKTATSLNDQFLFAITLQNFPWLSQEKGEVDKRLLALSEQGHPGAMYEYGYKLYREQRDIAKAIHWITRASTYGLARAEYRLGKILLSSPWVKKDEQKALFWFKSAVKKDHLAATLKTIELQIMADDHALRDLDNAIALLAKIEEAQYTNPEYFYLLSRSHIDRPNRDYTQVISNLERAIMLASRANWDVTEWENLLFKMTQGTVYISE